MLVLNDLGFRTLAIDLGKSGYASDSLPARLAKAMAVRYRDDNKTAEPVSRRVRRVVRRLTGR